MNSQESRNTSSIQKDTEEQQGAVPTETRSRRSWMERLSTRKGLLFLAGVSCLLMILAIVGVFYVISSTSVVHKKPKVTPPASLNDLVTEFPELSSILTDPRLDSVYKDFLVAYQEGGANAAYELAKKRGLLNAKDELVLTLELDTTDTKPLISELENHGIKITATSGNLIDIAVPMELIRKSIDSDNPGGIFKDITGLKHVIKIRMPIPTMVDAGQVDSESLPVIGALEWHEAGFTGKGIKIGILDKGFNNYKDLLGTDLPDEVTAKSFYSGYEPDNGTTEHGTAVAEIVHDVAPDAELFLAPYGSEAEMEQAVDWFLSLDVDIIQNSTGAVYGPFDGTGFKAKLVDRAVASGVLWVNAAGNSAKAHYRGAFTDDDGNGWHEFEPGEEMLTFTPPTGTISIVLNWDDWEKGDQDFDLYLYDWEGNEIASSRNTQNGPDSDSAEGMLYEFSDNGPYYAAFYAVHSTHPVTFDFFVWDGDLEYQTPGYSITTPGDAKNALTVGAVYWENDVLEDYSSQGPTQDGRLKPELVAPTMVSSVAYGGPWSGTSASAPHVSGAAALVLQAFPDFNPDQVIEFLEGRAVDLGDQGLDNVYGYGRLWLGDPPGTVSAPVPTEETEPPQPEETVTSASGMIATPTRHSTQTASSSERSTLKIALSFLVCAFLPGILGLGGIGLVVGISYGNRQLTIKEAAQNMTTGGSVGYPTSIEERIAPQVESGDICPRCGSSRRHRARFCSVCGYKFISETLPAMEVEYCKNCGQALRPESKFCARCGAPRN